MNLNRRNLTILLACFFVLVLAGGLFYYFKYYKTGADTLPLGTRCVIKVVDKDSGAPLVNASATFISLPKISTVYSQQDGCVSMPNNMVAVSGDFYQVNFSHSKYNFSQEYIKLSENIINGKLYQTVKLSKSSNISKTSSVGQKNIKADSLSDHWLGVEQAHAQEASNTNEEVQIDVDVVDSLSNKGVIGAKVSLLAYLENPQTKVLSWVEQSSCQTAESAVATGKCKLRVPGQTYGAVSTIGLNGPMYKIEVTKAGYNSSTIKVSATTLDIFQWEDDNSISVGIYIKLDPVLAESKISTITGKSLASGCAKSLPLDVYWVS